MEKTSKQEHSYFNLFFLPKFCVHMLNLPKYVLSLENRQRQWEAKPVIFDFEMLYRVFSKISK